MRMITLNKPNMSAKKLVSAFKSNPVSLAVIPAIVIALSFGLNYAYATWNEPPPGTTPPANNTDTPLNVGPAAQVKTGQLSLGDMGAGGILGASHLTAAFGPNDISGGATQLLIVGNVPGNAVLNLQPYSYGSTGGTLTMQGVSKTGGVGDMTLAVDGNILTGSNIGNNSYVQTYDVYLTSIGKWASTLGGSGAAAGDPLHNQGYYYCRVNDGCDDGQTPCGAWASYGCIGQVNKDSTCINQWFSDGKCGSGGPVGNRSCRNACTPI